eukprot:TRINITY_DN1306_c0_g2_i2.p1 TRINITY_DN1306_c0_g2~~TRINITY_DN1306_c0_g2_i2.p1  ORF type:complete len:753 (-),score=156.48 TRINITY_DN1306_c0_g2_i2:133-2391(-)
MSNNNSSSNNVNANNGGANKQTAVKGNLTSSLFTVSKDTLLSARDPPPKSRFQRMKDKMILRFVHLFQYLTFRRRVQPNSKFRARLDMLMLLCAVYNTWDIPFSAAFQWYPQYSLVLNFLIDVMFLVDVYLTFNTAFFGHGELVQDLKSIRTKYLKSWFLFDFIASLPLEDSLRWALCQSIVIPGEEGQGMYVCMIPHDALVALKFLKLLRMIRAWGLYYHRVEGLVRNVEALRMLRLFFVFFMLNHWAACGWWSFTRWSGFGTDEFLPSEEMEHMPVYGQYVRALFWSIVTMCRTGAMSLYPHTSIEAVYTYFSIFIGASVVAFLIAEFGIMVGNLNARENAFHAKMKLVELFIRNKNLPPEMGERMIQYYEYIWARQGIDDGTVLADLPGPLRSEVNLYLNKDIIEKVPLFKGTHQSFVSSLMLMLKPRIFMPNDVIIRAGDLGREMFFIVRGTVRIITPAGDTVASLHDGGFFGEIALVLGVKRSASVQAVTYCDLFELTKDDLDFTLLAYPEYLPRLVQLGVEKGLLTKEQLEKMEADADEDDPKTTRATGDGAAPEKGSDTARNPGHNTLRNSHGPGHNIFTNITNNVSHLFHHNNPNNATNHNTNTNTNTAPNNEHNNSSNTHGTSTSATHLNLGHLFHHNNNNTGSEKTPEGHEEHKFPHLFHHNHTQHNNSTQNEVNGPVVIPEVAVPSTPRSGALVTPRTTVPDPRSFLRQPSENNIQQGHAPPVPPQQVSISVNALRQPTSQ